MADENGAYTGQAVTDTVEDTRWHLPIQGSLEGRLEAWKFSYEVKPTNAQNLEIVIAGGGGVTADGFCNFDQSDLLVVRCRSDNGRMDGYQIFQTPQHTAPMTVCL